MAEQVNLHVGGQLVVSSALPGVNESPILPGRDPLCLGIGPAAIPGSMFVSGVTLLGSPLSYVPMIWGNQISENGHIRKFYVVNFFPYKT